MASASFIGAFMPLERRCMMLYLPDELLLSIFSYAQRPSTIDPDVKERKKCYRLLYSLAQSCRRFRAILLPSIYSTVSFAQHRPSSRRLGIFLELARPFGHICEDLTVVINEDMNPLLRFHALRDACQHFTALQVLCLDLLFPDSPGPWGVRRKTDNRTGLSSEPSAVRMGKFQKIGWAKLCTALSPSLVDLRLHGFHFEDASNGLRGEAHLPSVKSVHFDLATTSTLSLHSSRTFSQTFTGLKHITFPDSWCFSPEWVRRAFEHQRLESITTFNHMKGQRHRGHVCALTTECRWADSMHVLLKSQSESLVSLQSDALLFPKLAFRLCQSPRIITFPQLTSLSVTDLALCHDMNRLARLLRPFLSSPLQYLSLANCEDTPEGICDWLEDGFYNSGYLWPTLTRLCMDQWETSAGPGDEDIIIKQNLRGSDLNQPSYPHWRPQSRRRLEHLSIQRGIVLEGEWQWFKRNGWSWSVFKVMFVPDDADNRLR